MMYKCLHGELDFDFNIKYISDVHSYNTRNKQNLYLQKVNRNYGKHTFTYRGATDWNMLPTDVRNATDLRTFKLKLKKTLICLILNFNARMKCLSSCISFVFLSIYLYLSCHLFDSRPR